MLWSTFAIICPQLLLDIIYHNLFSPPNPPLHWSRPLPFPPKQILCHLNLNFYQKSVEIFFWDGTNKASLAAVSGGSLGSLSTNVLPVVVHAFAKWVFHIVRPNRAANCAHLPVTSTQHVLSVIKKKPTLWRWVQGSRNTKKHIFMEEMYFLRWDAYLTGQV